MTGGNFFDFQEKLQGDRAKAVAPNAANDANALTVAQLTAQIDRAIKTGVPSNVLVRGELSNVNIHRGSGHIYFTLKDASTCIDCVMFKSDATRLKFDPADGMEVLAGGSVKIYAQRGRYQLYANRLSPLGQGALEVAFQQLRAKLEAEGLFAPERKREIPAYPRRITIVTSSQTAALQDILKVLRRFSWLEIGVFHVPVQGDGAAPRIAAALLALGEDRSERRADVILLGRGGGSLEDLWAFNEEVVARAVARCGIPIISGIGHEVDVSISDLVADYHAHTPTEAAQVVTTHWRTARDDIDTTALRLRRGAQLVLQDARQRLSSIERHEIFRRPTDRINSLRQVLDDHQRSLTIAVSRQLRRVTERITRAEALIQKSHPRHVVTLNRQKVAAISIALDRAANAGLQRQSQRLESVEKLLRAVDPANVLRRGYSITTLKRTGTVITNATQAKPGDKLLTRLADGTVESVVDDGKQPGLFE